jgi:hypothetical protein
MATRSEERVNEAEWSKGEKIVIITEIRMKSEQVLMRMWNEARAEVRERDSRGGKGGFFSSVSQFQAGSVTERLTCTGADSAGESSKVASSLRISDKAQR